MFLSTSRSGNYLLALLATILTLCLCAAATEIAGRIQYHRWKKSFDLGMLKTITVQSKNPVLKWEYRPYGETTYYDIPMKMNRYGFRMPDLTMQKGVQEKRVALIGDSVALGMYVNDGDTFSSQLETALNKTGKFNPPARVLNFGIDGYNTIQIGELLRTRVLDFSPDVVVYVYCPNDFDFEDSSGNKAIYFKKPASFLVLGLTRAWRLLDKSEYHHRHFQKNRDIVFQEIIAMRDVLARKRIRFLVAMVPAFFGTCDEYPLRDMDYEVELFFEEKSIEHVNLLSALCRAGRLRAFAWDIWHPRREGNLIIAAELFKPAYNALIENSCYGSPSFEAKPAGVHRNTSSGELPKSQAP